MYPTFSTSNPQDEQILKIKGFLGLNISVNNTQIGDNESPEILNVLSDDKGALDGRKGWTTLNTSLGTGAINGILEYKKATGTLYLVAHGTKLYKINDITTEPYTFTELYTSMANARVRGFTKDDKFYMFDGTNYLVYNGTTVTAVVGYVPTVTIGAPPAGGGTTSEAKNLISAGFKQEFSADGTSTTYQLLYTGLDATTVTVTVNETAVVENTGFTVNRTNGTIDFSAGTSPHGAPVLGVNNVVITAYKTVSGDADKIKKCTQFALWGATEGNRLFVTGNPSYPNMDFRSGLLDPTYFPEDGFDYIGRDSDAILQYSFLYGSLLILKQDSIYIRQYYESDGDPVFSTQLLNSSIGASGKDSMAILDNFPTFVTSKGVYQVTSIDPYNEENVRCISEKINRNTDSAGIDGLLELGNLTTYQGIDFDKKYWLLHPTNDIAWVYDYDDTSLTYGQWYRLDNIDANVAIVLNNKLYFGRPDKGLVARFMTSSDSNNANDINEGTAEAIDKRWVSKVFDFDSTTFRKFVTKVFFTMKPAGRTSATLYVRSNLSSVWREVKEHVMSLFTYSLLTYSTFTYMANDFPQEIRTKTKDKKINYYQIKLENTELSETLGLLNASIKFMYQGESK